MKNSSYNHFFTLFKSHFALRKIVSNEKIINNIYKQFRADIAFTPILSILRFNKKKEDFMFKSQNIYNAEMKIRRKKFDVMIFI